MDTDRERKQGASNEIDVISAVANVNTCQQDGRGSPSTTSFFPELRTSPCQIYNRKDQKHQLALPQQQQIYRTVDRNNPMYSSSCHGGHQTSRSVAVRSSSNSVFQDMAKIQAEGDPIFQNNVKAGKSITCQQPVLPKERIKPEDFVSSWLRYGSQIQGSHFPEILSNKSHHIAHTVLCKSGKKTTLGPIQTRKTRKFSSKTSALSDL